MCEQDVEHLLHVFFDCPFARHCWQYVGREYDMSTVEYVPDWLIQQINNASGEDISMISRVLWGIWLFRNKKVWEQKVINSVTTMDWSSKCS